MAARATVYSADKWVFNFAGLQIKTGKGPDEFLKTEQQEDDFTYTAGIDGEGAFSENKNSYTKISLTLLQTSAGNDLLSAYHIASKLAGGLPAPLYVEDGGGNSKTISSAAMILKMPDEPVGKEVGVIVWEFGVHQPDRHVGGH